MDDDVEGLFTIQPCESTSSTEAQLVALSAGALDSIARDAKERMAKAGAFLWSLNVSHNPFLMKHGIDLSNGLCNGFFWGCINRHAEETFLRCWVLELRIRFGDGHEDVERSARFFRHDGALLRYRFLSAKTRCKLNRGGLQASLGARRSEEEEQSVQRLVNEFPELLRVAPGTALGLKFRKSLQQQLIQQNLLTEELQGLAELFAELQRKGELKSLVGAQWAAVKDQQPDAAPASAPAVPARAAKRRAPSSPGRLRAASPPEPPLKAPRAEPPAPTTPAPTQAPAPARVDSQRRSSGFLQFLQGSTRPLRPSGGFLEMLNWARMEKEVEERREDRMCGTFMEEVRDFLRAAQLKTSADVLQRGEGWTLVVSQLQGAPALCDLHQRLFAATGDRARSENGEGKSSGLSSGINAYLTPPDAIGKPPHVDDHDVLVLQLAGSKTWTLLDDARQTIREQVPLTKGDVMYLPQGIPHHAAAMASHEASLHLAVALHRRPMSYSSVLGALVTLRLMDPGDGDLLPAALVEEMEGRSQSFAAFGAREHWINQLLPMHLALVRALSPEDLDVGLRREFCAVLRQRSRDLAELLRSPDMEDADLGMPVGARRQRALLRASVRGSERDLEEAAQLPEEDDGLRVHVRVPVAKR
eukprot:g17362.t1